MWTLGNKHPILSRHLLQAALNRMLGPRGSRVLLVRGTRGSGRSFTSMIIEEFLQPFGHVAVPFKRFEAANMKPVDLLLDIGTRLGMQQREKPAANTAEPAQIRRNLVYNFLTDVRDGYPLNPVDGNRTILPWLIFDGFDRVPADENDRVEIDEGILDLIAVLAEQVGRAPALRLVLIGDDLPVSNDVEVRAESEAISPVTAQDVEAHLRYASRAGGSPLDEGLLVQMAARAVAPNADGSPRGVADIARTVQEQVAKL